MNDNVTSHKNNRLTSQDVSLHTQLNLETWDCVIDDIISCYARIHSILTQTPILFSLILLLLFALFFFGSFSFHWNMTRSAPTIWFSSFDFDIFLLGLCNLNFFELRVLFTVNAIPVKANSNKRLLRYIRCFSTWQPKFAKFGVIYEWSRENQLIKLITLTQEHFVSACFANSINVAVLE